MPIGGFDLGQALQQYEQIGNYREQMRKRREAAEQRQRLQENPLAEALINRQQATNPLGAEYRNDPELERQMENLFAPSGGWKPGQVEEYRRMSGLTRSLPQQARRQQMRAEMERIQMEQTDAEADEAGRIAAIQLEAEKSGDRSMLDAAMKLRQGIATNRRTRLAEQMRLLQQKYPDVLNDPELQESIKNQYINQQLGPMGPRGVTAPGQAQPQPLGPMPSTQLPTLRTRGLLGQ